jgi:hypothetical protein
MQCHQYGALLLVLCLLPLPTAASPIVVPASSARTTLSLNGPWTVTGQGFQGTVTVPTAIPFTATLTRWSRTFSLALSQRPLVAYLEFAGIVNSAVVQLNGVTIGRLTALTPTRLDVRTALIPNGRNRLEVEIDDRLTETSVPGGPTSFLVPYYGPIAYTFPIPWAHKPGIVRDVSLVYSPRSLITDVFAVQTLSADLRRVNVRVRVRVRGEAPQNVAALVGVTRGAVPVGNCKTTAFAADELACTITVIAPALWSPEQPALYDLWVTLYDVSGIADAVSDRIGFRTIQVRGNQIYLNNQPVFLRGISRHDLYGTRDFVASPRIIDQDLVRIKQLGVNFIRAIHYPPDERVVRRADELGLLLSEEIPAWAEFLEPAVMQQTQAMFRAMIERDFNRPSVICWLAGSKNTTDDQAYYLRMTSLAKRLDPHRLVSFVFDSPIYLPEDVRRYAQAARSGGMDLYAQNGYGLAFDHLIRALPTDIPVLITEWSGSEGSNRGPIGVPGVHAFPDEPDLSGAGVFSEEYQASTMVQKWRVWSPYLTCKPTSTTPCVAGLVFFNWQDVPWPGMPYYYEGHLPAFYSGLVYADRTPKTWPLAIFQALMSMLPGAR